MILLPFISCNLNSLIYSAKIVDCYEAKFVACYFVAVFSQGGKTGRVAVVQRNGDGAVGVPELNWSRFVSSWVRRIQNWIGALIDGISNNDIAQVSTYRLSAPGLLKW